MIHKGKGLKEELKFIGDSLIIIVCAGFYVFMSLCADHLRIQLDNEALIVET